MNFNGEIVFAISDSNYIDIPFELNILPTKIINKGDIIALERKASQNRWLHIIKFNDGKEYLWQLENLTNQLTRKRKYVRWLINKYEKVSIDIYIRSDFAEIEYSLPNKILKKLALLNCAVNFKILSFGMVANKNI